MRTALLVLGLSLLTAPLSAQSMTTVCKDGSPSATSGRGACSGHGGVDTKATKAAEKAAKAGKKAEKADEKAEKIEVTCSDGSKGMGGRGACSGHGGIGKMSPVEKKAEMAEKKADAAKGESKVATAKVEKAAGKAKEDNNPAGAIAKCKDGMYSHAANRQGACSRHKGVANWM